MEKAHPEQSYLKARLNYDPLTGEFIWNYLPDFSASWMATYAGTVAGNLNVLGYRHIKIDYSEFKAHRLAWIIMNGPIPAKMDIDHIDGDRSNNRIANLRLATRSQNAANTGAQKNSSHGVRNVTRRTNGKWQVKFRVMGQSHHIGTFDTLEEAKVEADIARIKIHGKFARAA